MRTALLVILFGCCVLSLVLLAQDSVMSDAMSATPFRRMEAPKDVLTRDTQTSAGVPFVLTATNAEDHVNLNLVLPAEGVLKDVKHVYLFQKGKRVALWIPLHLSVEEQKKSVQLTLPSVSVDKQYLVIACNDKRGDSAPPVPDPAFLPMFYEKVFEVQIKSYISVAESKNLTPAQSINVTIESPQKK